MKMIPVGKFYHAIVSDKDYKELSKFKWTAWIKKHTIYARRITNGKTINMHTAISGVALVDHKDHNGLNNQRNNLRPCNNSNNLRNRRGYGASKYKGVCRKRKKWAAYINTNGKQKYLGTFTTQIAAAIAYNKAAIASKNRFFLLNHIKKRH